MLTSARPRVPWAFDLPIWLSSDPICILFFLYYNLELIFDDNPYPLPHPHLRDLRMEHVGQTVTLAGFLENIREVGQNFAFAVLSTSTA